MAIRHWLSSRGAVTVAMVVCCAGCAARHAPNGLTDRFVRQGEPEAEWPGDIPPLTEIKLETDEIQRAVRSARPEPRQPAPSLESQHPDIVGALRAVAMQPTSDAYRRLGDAYLGLGVRDAAYDQFTRAIELDRRNASAWDGRARIWRDWGFAHVGLGDAYRAIAMAPRSPIPHNTLGTIFLRRGQRDAARVEFERAIALDPHARYALTNLCAIAPASRECEQQ